MILGNLLIERSSNLPVIIAEERCLNSLNVKLEEMIIIPYSSLGNSNGFLYAFKADNVKVCYEDEYENKKAYIGIYKGTLNEDSNEYNAIIGL